MSAGFQANAFQNTAFQTSIVVSTVILPLPINCVLIGHQLYERTGRTFERIRGRSGTMVRASSTSVQKLDGDTPIFTVKSNPRGYD